MSHIEPLVEKAEQFGKTTYELIKLKAVDKTATVTSMLVSRGAVVLVASMFVIIATIGVSLWLGELLGKTYYGFFCVAGIYGVTGLILYFVLHKRIKEYVSNSIVSQLMN